jgi:hypothetical protein
MLGLPRKVMFRSVSRDLLIRDDDTVLGTYRSARASVRVGPAAGDELGALAQQGRGVTSRQAPRGPATSRCIAALMSSPSASTGSR